MTEELEVKVYQTESTLCLAPSGRIMGDSGAALRRVVDLHLSPRIDQIALNLSHVDFIDSSGLGVLVGLKSRCVQNKIDLLLLDPSPQMWQILSVARLDVIFNVARGAEAEAIRSRVMTEDHQVQRIKATADMSLDGGSHTMTSPGGEAWVDPAEAPDPRTRANALCKDAIEKVRLGEYPRAIELYGEALSIDPDSLSALNNLALIYEKRPVWMAQAIRTWEKVLALSRKLDDRKHVERAEQRLSRLRARLSENA
ncbi:MAG: anti-sigma factor antagonist [Candidatus Sumerlaeota bacterium]|nr:anti-sigma factor antagonist [Candidatus Sumerlaeota bacterium]